MGKVTDGVFNAYTSQNTTTAKNPKDFGMHNEYQVSYFVLVFLLLLLSALIISHTITFRLQLRFLPEAAAVILVGVVGGLLCLLHSDGITDSLMRFDPTIFFVAFLPPIIFNSGYTMKRRFFFQNFTGILCFAIVGTLISTLAIGSFLFTVGYYGLSLKLSFAECLAFGSLISATDPVSTLAVFQELRVDPLLFYLVFGESVLNDAVAIVLFSTFSKYVGLSHTISSVLIAVLDFILIFVGSTLIGLFFGLFSALLFKFFSFRGQHLHEVGVYFILSYLPFLVSEAVKMSGIVSVLFAAISMKHYAHKNLSPEAQETAQSLFHVLAHLSEASVFLNLGLSVVALQLGYNVPFILWSVLFCLASRAIHVYPLSFLLNACQKNKIPKNQQHMLWFSGLRGAIAFALSLSFPGHHRTEIISCTMVIILITIFVMGGATIPMLDFLSIRRLSHDEERALDVSTRLSQRVRLLRWDEKYLLPFFTWTSPPEELGSCDPDGPISSASNVQLCSTDIDLCTDSTTDEEKSETTFV